jgi:hypothetical protein
MAVASSVPADRPARRRRHGWRDRARVRSMRTIFDTHGRPLRVERCPGDRGLTVQATISTTRQLDRDGVRVLLDVIASSPALRREMRRALAVYDVKA